MQQTQVENLKRNSIDEMVGISKLLTDVEQGEEVEAASEYRKNPQSENHLKAQDNVNQSSNYLR